MRIIIAGGRDYDDYDTVKSYCDTILTNIKEVEIVSGRCSDDKKGVLTFTTDDGIKVYGADGLGERYAKEKGYKVNPFPAKWKTHGKKAGYIRNKEMALYADGLIAFWDYVSRGTKMMIDIATEEKLKVAVKKVKSK